MANSLSESLVTSLDKSLEELKTNEQVRVLILRSLVPNIFCAGADLKERAQMPIKAVPLFVQKLRCLASKIQDFPCPTIAAIDGAALGGGLEFALATDIRIASDSARMGLVETRLAIIPGAGGTQRLPRIVPPHIAKELILTGRTLNGLQAHQYGLVNHAVVQNDSLDGAYQKALSLGQEMLQCGPVALRAAKLAINQGLQTDIATGMAIEALCYSMVVNTKDRIEGLNSFKDKRKPNFIGE